MKKLVIMTVGAILGTTAFAQDVFKQVSKIKDYNEASSLLKSNLGSISAEEKAKCYNALVDISYSKVVKEQAIVTSNQMAEQLKTKVEPYDTVGLYTAVLTSLEDGVKCDEFDNQPNEKGKVKPKFHKSNGDRLYAIRFHLINAGVYYQNVGNDNLAYKYLAAYVESSDYPLFAEQDKSKDANLTQIAYYASRYAYFEKEYDKAEKYADIALNDTAFAKDAMQLKLAVMQAQLKTHADSVNYVAKLKDIYAKDESNDMIFSTICSMYISMNDTEALNSTVAAKIAKDPNNFTALAMQGQVCMNEQKWDDAISSLNKALEQQPNNVAVIASIGNSYMYKAQDQAQKAVGTNGRIAPADEKAIIEVYNTAINYLERAKNLDTDNQFKSVWAYSLYTCCYRTLGADDPKTKEYEALTR
ncbi:MAG: hypothetical protein Q4D41_07215 [Prevotellaceae bacterium]|nr:hypothetical protein [Prevotellaceae bacterium]